mgnify:CR=1 FL=1
MEKGFINVEVLEKVATITFFHPQSNSFPSYLLEELSKTFNVLSNNQNIAVIVLQSKGKTFCSGASFNELITINNLEEGKEFFSGFAKVINAMRKCSKIIIGKIQGKAVGGGVGLICACDFNIALNTADIKLSELTIGIGPFVIEPVITKRIGIQNFAQLTLQAKDFKSAHWAFDKGVYDKLVNSNEELDFETEKLVKELSSYNIEALASLKQIFWKDYNHLDDLLYERAATSGKLILSEHSKNTLSTFKK